MPEALASAKTLQIDRDREDVSQAVLAALPKDAIVRSEDDAVGRFAGERTVVIVGRQHDRLLMFRGSYGAIKRRLEDDPDVRVRLEPSAGGTQVGVELRVETSKPVQEITGALVTNGISVAVLIVAVNMYRGAETDPTQAALISLGVAIVVTFLGRRFAGPTPAESLVELVDGALKPLAPKAIERASE